MRTTVLILWVSLFTLTPNAFCGIDFFVAVKGDDKNPGTREQPFATLERARDAIRALKEIQNFPDSDITVWIREGAYSIHSSFVLDERDSGQENARVVYRSYQNENVRLLGGTLLPNSAARPLRDKNMFTRLDNPEAGKNIVVFELKELGINNFGKHQKYGHGLPVVPAPIELFFNHEAMPLARYPNNGSIKIGKVIDKGSVPRIGDYSNRGGIFEYTDDRHARWAGLEDVWLQGTFMWGYADDKILIEQIDPDTRRVKLTTPHMYGVGSGKPYQQYVALNIFEELDSPGEWYLDRQSGHLYFWPPAPLEQAEIAVSIIEQPMICLEGASYVTIRDLTIEFGRDMGIYIERGEHNLIAGCTLRNLGTIGILMGQGARQTVAGITHDDYEGEPVSRAIGSLASHRYHHTTWYRKAGYNHTILSCDIYNTGAGGVVLSGGNKATLEPGNSAVENCKIWNNQRRNKFTWAGISVDGVGNRVAHNEVFDSDFQGIMVRGNEHVFEFNNIHDLCRDSDDTSPWYMGRDPSDRGIVVRYNFFHNIGRADRMGMGVYLDDATCGALVHGNIFYKVASYGTVYSNSGSDNVISNNIFIDGFGPALHIKSMWFSWAIRHIPTYFDEGGIFRRRLQKLVDITKPPYSEHYPNLANWMDLMPDGKTFVGMIPKRNVFEKNLVYNYEEVLRLDHPNIELVVRDNFYTNSDPGFVDAENLNFELRDDAIVYEKIPGFESIPFEDIGLYVDEYKTRKKNN